MSRPRVILLALCLAAASLAPALSKAVGADSIAGVPANLVGLHGPTQDFGSGLDLVGKSSITPVGDSLPAGNNGAPALIGNCAYVGRWHDYNTNGNLSKRHGTQIIDIANPSAPTVVGSIADTIVSGGVAREMRAIDLPGFKMLTVLVFAEATGDRTRNKIQFYTFPSGNCRTPVLAGTYDMKAFRGHEFFQWLDPVHSVNGHPRILEYVTAPIVGNLLVVDASDPTAPQLIGAYDAGQPVVSPNEAAGTYLGKYAHSISLSPDGTEAYISYWDGGFFTMDTTAFTLGVPAGGLVAKGAMSVPFVYPLGEFGNTHSAVKIPGQNAVVVGDEIYITTDGCPFGWMRTLSLGSPIEPPHQLGEFRLPENDPANCVSVTDSLGTTYRIPNERNSNGELVDGTFSMHNQTVTGRYALATWYGGGLRVVDVGNPTAPTEAAFFVPKPLDVTPTSTPTTSLPTFGRTGSATDDWQIQMWSYPVVRNGLIYVTDVRNGLYILKPSAAAPAALQAEIAATRFREGNSNFGDLA